MPGGYGGYSYSGAGVVPQGGQQLLGSGYGDKVLAPPEIQQMYAGKPAFFDAERGVYFDGHSAYIYQAGYSGGSGAGLNLAEGALATAHEKSIVLGNGTEGNLQEHANALASSYLLDKVVAVSEH